MNDRIKELANEAGLLVHNPNGVPTKLEKFAELIVRECGTVLNNNYPPDDLLPIEEVMECLKKHFGVKE